MCAHVLLMVVEVLNVSHHPAGHKAHGQSLGIGVNQEISRTHSTYQAPDGVVSWSEHNDTCHDGRDVGNAELSRRGGISRHGPNKCLLRIPVVVFVNLSVSNWVMHPCVGKGVAHTLRNKQTRDANPW